MEKRNHRHILAGRGHILAERCRDAVARLSDPERVVAEAMCSWWHHHYPVKPTAWISSIFGWSERTSRRVLRGHVTFEQLVAIGARFPHFVSQAVHRPLDKVRAARADRRLAAQQARIERLEDDCAAARNAMVSAGDAGTPDRRRGHRRVMGGILATLAKRVGRMTRRRFEEAA
jgi:hypothetical protein